VSMISAVRRLGPLAVLALVATACTPAGQPAAWDAAGRFQAALASNDRAGACQLLSDEARDRLEITSRRPCPEALAVLSLPTGSTRSIQTWGGVSQVRLDGAVLFLAEFKAGWRVTAAGCTPRAEQPYACSVAA
jgi:hypothetical protein